MSDKFAARLFLWRCNEYVLSNIEHDDDDWTKYMTILLTNLMNSPFLRSTQSAIFAFSMRAINGHRCFFFCLCLFVPCTRYQSVSHDIYAIFYSRLLLLISTAALLHAISVFVLLHCAFKGVFVCVCVEDRRESIIDANKWNINNKRTELPSTHNTGCWILNDLFHGSVLSVYISVCLPVECCLHKSILLVGNCVECNWHKWCHINYTQENIPGWWCRRRRRRRKERQMNEK